MWISLNWIVCVCVCVDSLASPWQRWTLSFITFRLTVMPAENASWRTQKIGILEPERPSHDPSESWHRSLALKLNSVRNHTLASLFHFNAVLLLLGSYDFSWTCDVLYINMFNSTCVMFVPHCSQISHKRLNLPKQQSEFLSSLCV